MKNNDIQTLIQKYFLQRLMAQRNVSPETIKSYRDAFRLYLKYIETRCGIPPVKMSISQFDADHILGFLAYLDKERDNTPKTINSRLAALHSFVKYLIFELPEYSGLLNRSLMVPFRKVEKRQMEFLTEDVFLVNWKCSKGARKVQQCRYALALEFDKKMSQLSTPD